MAYLRLLHLLPCGPPFAIEVHLLSLSRVGLNQRHRLCQLKNRLNLHLQSLKRPRPNLKTTIVLRYRLTRRGMKTLKKAMRPLFKLTNLSSSRLHNLPLVYSHPCLRRHHRTTRRKMAALTCLTRPKPTPPVSRAEGRAFEWLYRPASRARRLQLPLLGTMNRSGACPPLRPQDLVQAVSNIRGGIPMPSEIYGQRKTATQRVIMEQQGELSSERPGILKLLVI